MTHGIARETGITQLRLKLIGKPLVGFDTRRWGKLGDDGSAEGRVGNKAGRTTGKVGIKGAPTGI